MELELGLKITKTKHDFTSTSQFQFSKHSSGPVFLSRETNNLFILIAHLKGFEKDQIAIKINEDGTQIAISAEKAVQEMAMVGWIMQEKEVEFRGFVKIFRIPDGIDLDRIKAKFDEQDAILRILMPKLVKGIRGVGIEEVKEEDVYRGRPEMTIISSQEIPNCVVKMEETDRIKQKQEIIEEDSFPLKQEDQDEKRKKKEEFRRLQSELLHGLEAMKGSKESQSDHLQDDHGIDGKEIQKEKNEIEEESQKEEEHAEETEACVREPMVKQYDDRVEAIKKKKPFAPTKLKLCTPCLIASSTVIVSIVVFALHWFRSKRKEVP